MTNSITDLMVKVAFILEYIAAVYVFAWPWATTTNHREDQSLPFLHLSFELEFDP